MQSCRLVWHMPCPHCMQFWSLRGMCHANIHAISEPETHIRCHHYICIFMACVPHAMSPLHAGLEYIGHIQCHPYMQFPSLWCTCHALRNYFILYYTLNLIGPMGHQPWYLQGMHHILIMCNPGARVGICNALYRCNSGACDIYVMPSLHAISELMAYIPCPQHMQFWSLHCTCHTTFICNSRIC